LFIFKRRSGIIFYTVISNTAQKFHVKKEEKKMLLFGVLQTKHSIFKRFTGLFILNVHPHVTKVNPPFWLLTVWSHDNFTITPQALVSFKKYMSPPLPYFKVNIYPFPLPHFASIFFAYLWSFRWPNYIVTLPRYFSFRLPHLTINTGSPSDELDKNIQRTWLGENFSHWNGYGHFRSGLNWFRKF
jgi:hypothetical protein